MGSLLGLQESELLLLSYGGQVSYAHVFLIYMVRENAYF